MLNFIKNLISSKPIKPTILVFCGAGISQESGLTTFREQNGIWSQENLNDVCNLKTFEHNKEKVFEFYNARKAEILKVQPNEAHQALASLQKSYLGEIKIYTSNIDNLLEKASCKNVIHVHGDTQHMNCLDCGHTWHIGNKAYCIDETCPQCSSSTIKPAIIFFNEPAPYYKELKKDFENAGKVVKNTLIPNIKLLIGTSFKVVDLHTLKPKRGTTILVDKNPNIKGFENDFYQIIEKPSSRGVSEAIELIKKINICNNML